MRNFYITENLRFDEIICACCGRGAICDRLVEAWKKFRAAINTPIIISSGFRCEKHNKEVGGKSDSRHLYGEALDIIIVGCKDHNNLEIIEKAKAAGFKGIGIDENFLHLDVRKIRNVVIWYYEDA